MKTKKTARKAFNRKSFIMNVLRKASYKYPYMNEAVKRARVDRGVYECNGCKGRFKIKELKRDHVNPVIEPGVGFVDWNTYIDRLLCESVYYYQMLCADCHNKKTGLENEQR